MDEPTHQQGAGRASTAAPRFSIFIPTYNRAHLLPRALESIAAQTCRDFEVVIVDDGSTDGTAALVEAWQGRASFPIVYCRQENQGKHGAHNAALPLLRGELTVILDSDDLLVPDALERLARHWDAIPPDQRPAFSGIEGLSAFFDGRLNGSGLPQPVLDADYLSLRRRHRVRGDMKGCVRTDLLRRFPFPRFDGERHIRPSLLWNRIAREYRTRCAPATRGASGITTCRRRGSGTLRRPSRISSRRAPTTCATRCTRASARRARRATSAALGSGWRASRRAR
ncbi:MAG: glycosyltransferase family 2 protein [Gammaproteobacteria bacterium]|nr:glycosyltransferase family 2 protein [Gammaproteobacteria bacterium]